MKLDKKNMRKGDRFFKKGVGYYPQAVDYYLKAQEFNPDNASLNYKIGNCLFKTGHKGKSGEYFKKSYELNPLVDSEIKLMLGKYYHFTGQFDTAITMFKMYKQESEDEISENKDILITKQIMECKHGKDFYAKPVRAFVDHLGAAVNSAYADYSPVIEPGGSTLYFTSRRPEDENADIQKDVYGFGEKVYQATRNNSGAWSEPSRMGKSINKEDHNGIISISTEGDKIYLYSSEDGGDIYYSRQKAKDKWSKPRGVSGDVNTKYHEAYACFSNEGQKLFYVSDHPDGYGKHDIYESEMNKRGKWNEGVNLGTVINSVYDETAIYMHPDGKTLFFSSNGHNSMGGYDIFKTHIDESGEWSMPENLGYPINTSGDDLFISFDKNGRKAYIASERPGGKGDTDIYEVMFLGEEKQILTADVMYQQSEYHLNPWHAAQAEPAVDLEVVSTMVMKGKVFDSQTKDPLQAEITITDNETNEVLAIFKSDSSTGDYIVKLRSGKNYGLAIQAEDHLFYSENINLTGDKKTRIIEKNIGLNRVEIGKHIVLRNIFFDTDKATLRDASRSELDRLYEIMQDYPNIRVEISGHTDNVGSAEYNKKLSERRAKAVVDYLLEKGISKDRFEYKGLGFDQPIATNETEEGRQKNRRTEFKIISD